MNWQGNVRTRSSQTLYICLWFLHLCQDSVSKSVLGTCWNEFHWLSQHHLSRFIILNKVNLLGVFRDYLLCKYLFYRAFSSVAEPIHLVPVQELMIESNILMQELVCVHVHAYTQPDRVISPELQNCLITKRLIFQRCLKGSAGSLTPRSSP